MGIQCKLTMEVVETKLGTEWSDKPNSLVFTIIEGVLRKLIPLANPDFDRTYKRVRKWWIELDETGIPQRELGFDQDGGVIVAGPICDNLGFWTDSTMTFSPTEHKRIPEEAFESAWSLFQAAWEESRTRWEGS